MGPGENAGIPRRLFLTTLTAGAAALALPARAQDPLHVLKPGDFERLRLDFNANRERVRLVAYLSPT